MTNFTVNCRSSDFGLSFLHVAAMHGLTDIITDLVSFGAPNLVDSVDRINQTPIVYGIAFGELYKIENQIRACGCLDSKVPLLNCGHHLIMIEFNRSSIFVSRWCIQSSNIWLESDWNFFDFKCMNAFSSWKSRMMWIQLTIFDNRFFGIWKSHDGAYRWIELNKLFFQISRGKKCGHRIDSTWSQYKMSSRWLWSITARWGKSRYRICIYLEQKIIAFLSLTHSNGKFTDCYCVLFLPFSQLAIKKSLKY